MKLLYVVACNTEVDSSMLCDLMKNKLPNTAFPGCWIIDPKATEEMKENVISSVSSAINHFIKSPEYENIIFGWGGESVINELLSRIETSKCDVKIINFIEAEKLISKHKI